ncbi:TPA: hypothetical protein DDW35_01305, partial [Candidatus Sumerlaeota bacterium]|nr:hypothetical protein [Candidatus Sumerlaeota bacterium]
MRLTPAFQFRTSEMPVPTRQQAKRSRKIASRFGTLVVTLLLAASVCPVGAQAPAGNQAASLPGGADAQLTSVESAARQSTGSKLETINVTMEFRDVELQEVIRMIAEKAHLNVVFDPKVVVGSKVTLKLENVKLGAALENILSTRQLTYVVRPADNILRVLPSTSAGESALETISEVVPLKYLYAPRAAKMLETVFKADEMKTQVTENKQQNQGASVAQQVQQGIAAATQGGQASQQVQSTKNLVGISYHLESNSLLLIAPPALLAKMKDMVYQLDVPANKPQQAVTRIVEINWMDADDMMSVLTKVFIPGST